MYKLPLIERSCGGCTACCTAVAVEELSKPPGVACEHIDRAVGCSVYDRRPKGCREWSCLWLQGAFEDAARPDRLGVVVDCLSKEHPHEGTIYFAHEAFPNGFAFAETFLLALAAKDVVFALRPDGTARAMGTPAKIEAAMAAIRRLAENP